MSKEAKTIQFDRDDLLRLASRLHHECYKIMEAVRLEDLRLTCLDYDERIKGLEDEHEKKIEEDDDWWQEQCDDIKKRVVELEELEKLYLSKIENLEKKLHHYRKKES